MAQAGDQVTTQGDGDGKELAALRRSVGLKLTITARQMRRHFDQLVAEVGVTRSQWTVIAAVSRLPGSTQRTLAQVLEMSEASTGRLVDRLCADGLLQRRPKDEDRRAHCVFLTGEGEALMVDLMRLAAVHEGAVFAGLDAGDLQRLDDLVERMLDNMGRPTRDSLGESPSGKPSRTKRKRPPA